MGDAIAHEEPAISRRTCLGCEKEENTAEKEEHRKDDLRRKEAIGDDPEKERRDDRSERGGIVGAADDVDKSVRSKGLPERGEPGTPR